MQMIKKRVLVNERLGVRLITSIKRTLFCECGIKLAFLVINRYPASNNVRLWFSNLNIPMVFGRIYVFRFFFMNCGIICFAIVYQWTLPSSLQINYSDQNLISLPVWTVWESSLMINFVMICTWIMSFDMSILLLWVNFIILI